MGLFSDMEKFGLGNLKNANLYEEKKGAKLEDGAAKAAPTIQESDFLFDKNINKFTYNCKQLYAFLFSAFLRIFGTYLSGFFRNLSEHLCSFSLY